MADDFFEPKQNLRESTNVQDVRAYPPRPNPRSRGMLGFGMPHYYDPAVGKYQDSMIDAVTSLVRLGLSKRAQDENKLSPEELEALVRTIRPIFGEKK